MATVVVNGGLAIITNRLRGSGLEPVYIGWGTGAGTAAIADTSLFTERAVDLSATTGTRTTGTSAQATTDVSNDTWRLTGTRTATGSGTVTNAGCFDDVDISEGNLFLKGDFTGIGLASGDSIAFTINADFDN